MTIFFFLLWLILGPLCYGFVLSTAWGWIVVPLFGLPKLSIAAAWGVMIVASMFHFPAQSEKEWSPEVFSKMVIYSYALGVVRLIVALPCAWVAKRLMFG